MAAATAAHMTVRRRCERLLATAAATVMVSVLQARACWVRLVAAAAALHSHTVVAGRAEVEGALRSVLKMHAPLTLTPLGVTLPNEPPGSARLHRFLTHDASRVSWETHYSVAFVERVVHPSSFSPPVNCR